MKVKYIRIELERDEHDNPEHATLVEFRDGMWRTNGPVYSRINEALHGIWKLLREGTRGGHRGCALVD